MSRPYSEETQVPRKSNVDIKPIVSIYLPSLGGGGAERALVNLSNALADKGVTIDLVLANATGPYLLEVSSDVNVVNLGKSRVITSLPKLVIYLRKRQPTTILSALEHANVIALLASRIAGGTTRVVVSERNNTSLKSTYKKDLRHKIILYLKRLLYPAADAIHAVSHGVADSCAYQLRLPRQKIAVIYNPVVTQNILNRAAADEKYPWLSENPRQFIFSAGRLTKQKDFPTLIRAFALVRKCIDIRLVIVGEGESRSELESLTADLDLNEHVLLPGFVDNPFYLMKRADLFVLSSIWEGLPNVLIQAMACGTPVVSTNCPSGPEEILEKGKWGRLVPVGDVESLAQAMIDTLRETEHPDVASRAAYFSVKRATDGFLQLLLPDAMP
jgi:glycosyltransferase involved in cell wall biosynthesis